MEEASGGFATSADAGEALRRAARRRWGRSLGGSCVEDVVVSEFRLENRASRCEEKNSGATRAVGDGTGSARRVETGRRATEARGAGPAKKGSLSQRHGRAGARSRGRERTGAAVAGRSISGAWLGGVRGRLEHFAWQGGRIEGSDSRRDGELAACASWLW